MIDADLIERLRSEVVNEQRSMADLAGACMDDFLLGFAAKVAEECAKVCDHWMDWDSAAAIRDKFSECDETHTPPA